MHQISWSRGCHRIVCSLLSNLLLPSNKKWNNYGKKIELELALIWPEYRRKNWEKNISDFIWAFHSFCKHTNVFIFVEEMMFYFFFFDKRILTFVLRVMLILLSLSLSLSLCCLISILKISILLTVLSYEHWLALRSKSSQQPLQM